tara:strand:- start:267 stop:932 length:666 start_codon:yes stop_codon:yes gene_type:complete
MTLDFTAIIPSIPFILEGIVITLKYTFFSVFFGLILGMALALMKLSKKKLFSGFAVFYTSLFRGTPLLVQLSLFYFATPQLTGYKISAFESGILAFSLNSGAYISEIIRAGIMAVDKGQFEAMKALGIPYTPGMKDLILPQALKNILPALMNEIVDLLKESSLVSVIGEMDLLRRANLVASEKFIYFEPLLLVAVLYYILVLIFSSCARLVEKRMKRHDTS